jgi:cytosolic prostaglandin-E synthase
VFIFRIDEDSLFFKAVGLPENKNYEVKINFLKKINPEKVISKNSGRCYEFVITKADTTSEYWKSLTSDKKPHWLKVDFNKWKDEGSDDEDEGMGGMGGMGGMPGMDGGMGGMGNFNDLMSQMGGMGGMGGMGMGGDGKPSFDDLENEEDSDDEEIPDLEEAKK